MGRRAGVCGAAPGGGREEQLSMEPKALRHLPHHGLLGRRHSRQRSTVSVCSETPVPHLHGLTLTYTG